jgi:hypothetical protein
MRILIATILAAGVALSPAPAAAQATNAATTANTAAPAPETDVNLTTDVQPVDSNLVATTEAAPPADVAAADTAAVTPVPRKRPQPFPWGLLGVLGLLGLLGRRRADR